MTLDRISGTDLKTWLDNLGVAGATLNGYRGHVVTFLRWCMDNKLLPKTWDEHDAIKRRIEVPGKDAAIYTPQTMKRLLLAAQQNMTEWSQLSFPLGRNTSNSCFCYGPPTFLQTASSRAFTANTLKWQDLPRAVVAYPVFRAWLPAA